MNKSKIILISFLLIFFIIKINPVFAMKNPAAVYCKELGYKYEINTTASGDEYGMCVFPDGSACKDWDFLKGKCGKEFSYCARHGYDIKTVKGKGSFSSEYAVCTPRKGLLFRSPLNKLKKDTPVTDLMGLSKKLSSGLKPRNEKRKSISTSKPPRLASHYNASDFSYWDWRDPPNGTEYSKANSTFFDDDYGWLTPVKNQGNCGSCWAFSAVGGVEAKYEINKNESRLNPDLSEQYLVSDCCGYCGNCGGGDQISALNYTKNDGISDENCFPYIAANSACSNRCSNYNERLWNLSGGDYSGYWYNFSNDELEQWIIDNGSLPIAIDMDGYPGAGGDGSDDFDSNGIFRCTEDDTLDHAVVLVGYNDTGNDTTSYWIIKNSWDTNWPSNSEDPLYAYTGYFRIGFGECNVTDYVTYVDTVNPPNFKPSITLHGPEQNHESNTHKVEFNFTVYNRNATTSSCDLIIDNEIKNTTSSANNATPTVLIYNLQNGTYNWKISCWENKFGIVNSSETRTLAVAIPPTYSSPQVSPSSGSEYIPSQTYQFNITWNGNTEVDTVFIENNFTSGGGLENATASNHSAEYYKTFSDMAAGNYTYKWYANDSAGNWNSTPYWTYVINKAPTSTNLLLNGTDGDKSYNYSRTANFTVFVNITGKTVYLDTNLTGWSTPSGTTPLMNYTTMSQYGVFNITGYFPGDQNYSSSSETHYATMHDLPPKWQNQGTNDTDNVIPVAGAINLTAQGFDETALDWAWLETNETGSWQNKTTYNSPMDMNDASAQWVWSNFTWKNTSITTDKIIGWRIYYNDTYGNENVTNINSFQIDASGPQWSSNTTSPLSPTTYSQGQSYKFNITWTDAISGVSEAIFEFNGTNYTSSTTPPVQNSSSEYYITLSDLPASTYTYKWYANDSANNWNISDTWTYTVSQAATNITLTLNGTRGNEEYSQGKIANITAALNVSGKTLYLYANYSGVMELIANGTDILTNFTNTGNLNEGHSYMIKANWTGDENYTSDEEIWYLTVDSVPPAYSGEGESVTNQSQYIPGRNYGFQINWTDNSGISDVVFEWNNTNYTYSGGDLNNSGNTYWYNLTDLPAGNYTYKWYANDSSGNWNNSFPATIYTISRNQTNPVDIFINNGTVYKNQNISIIYETSINVNATPVYPRGGVVNLYRNNTYISGANETIILAAKIYQYKANITGNENYTDNTTDVIYYLTVSKKDPSSYLNLVLNGTAANVTHTYPQSVNATGWSALSDNQDLVFKLYRNGTASNVSYGDPATEEILLGNGTYAYTYNTSGNVNYSSGSVARIYRVLKGDTNTTLLINGTSANISIKNNTALNFTVVLNVSGKAVNLTINMTDWDEQSEATPLENLTILNINTSREIFNITGYFPGDDNYSSSHDTRFVEVTTLPPYIISYSRNDSYIKINQSVLLEVNVTDDLGVDTVWAEIQKPSGSRNYTLSNSSGNFTLIINRTMLGWQQENLTQFVNITRIFANNTLGNMKANSTHLNFSYAATVIYDVEAVPSSLSNKAGNSVEIRFKWNTTEPEQLNISTCQVTVNFHTYNVSFDTSDQRYEKVIEVTGWSPGTYTYNVTCFNSSYQTQNITSSFKVTQYSAPSGSHTSYTSYIFVTAEEPECTSDMNCSSYQKCENETCVNITCECGYIKNHACINYECCQDENCLENQTCKNHTCISIPALINETLERETKKFLDFVESYLQNKSVEYNVSSAFSMLEKAKELYQNQKFREAMETANKSLYFTEKVPVEKKEKKWPSWPLPAVLILLCILLLKKYEIKKIKNIEKNWKKLEGKKISVKGKLREIKKFDKTSNMWYILDDGAGQIWVCSGEKLKPAQKVKGILKKTGQELYIDVK